MTITTSLRGGEKRLRYFAHVWRTLYFVLICVSAQSAYIPFGKYNELHYSQLTNTVSKQRSISCSRIMIIFYKMLYQINNVHIKNVWQFRWDLSDFFICTDIPMLKKKTNRNPDIMYFKKSWYCYTRYNI